MNNNDNLPVMCTRLALTGVLLFVACSLSAQVWLQMEKRGSARTVKFRPGEVLTWRMAGDRTWYQEELVRLIPEDSIVVFANRYVKLDQITAIRSFAGSRWSKPVSRQLYLFGLSWSAYALIADVFDETDPYDRGDLGVTLTSFATGFVLHQVFKSRTFRLGKRRRLRIVDLRIRS